MLLTPDVQAILQLQTILNAREVKFPDKVKISDDAKVCSLRCNCDCFSCLFLARGLQAFIRRCLTYDVNMRPDVVTLCEDPYLKKKLSS